MLKKIIALSILFAASNTYAADITVSAAASLKDAFEQIAQNYQKQYPQDKIKLNTAASGVLLQQLKQGAPVDVLATADMATMQKATQDNLVQAAKPFAQNRLVLITPQNSAKSLTKLSDLTRANKIAIGKPESVPAGKYAQQSLQKVNLFNQLKPKFVYTQNVRQALDYVSRGEVDAGFVYETDAKLKNVKIVATVAATEPVIYPIAVTSKSKEAATAKRFVQYVLSPQGQTVLQRYGFTKP